MASCVNFEGVRPSRDKNALQAVLTSFPSSMVILCAKYTRPVREQPQVSFCGERKATSLRIYTQDLTEGDMELPMD